MTRECARKFSNLVFAVAALFVFSIAASAATCDRACLLEQATGAIDVHQGSLVG